jgi:RNA polymerase sigma factor (sigma-70 family)
MHQGLPIDGNNRREDPAKCQASPCATQKQAKHSEKQDQTSAVAGDGAVFSEVVVRTAPWVWDRVARIWPATGLGGITRDDLLQEVYLKLWVRVRIGERYQEVLRDDKRLYKLLRRLWRDTKADVLRRRGSQKREPNDAWLNSDTVFQEAPAREDPYSAPDGVAEARDLVKWLSDQITEQDRKILDLLQAGATKKEIAASAGRDLSTVWRRIQRFRELLEDGSFATLGSR